MGRRARRLPNGVSRRRPSRWVPVVALGASAGGLEALTDFLRAFAPGLGVALVVVQHLAHAHTTPHHTLLVRPLDAAERPR